MPSLPLFLLAACTLSEPPPPKQVQPMPPEGMRFRHDPLDVDPELLRLQALGYVDGSVLPEGVAGVTVSDPDRMAPGYHLVTSGHGAEIALEDLSGTVLHTWGIAFEDAFGQPPPALDDTKPGYFRRAHLLDDGGVLGVFEGLGMVRIDRDSKLVWADRSGQHHDLEVRDDGTVVTLEREAVRVDGVATLTETIAARKLDTGELLWRRPLTDIVKASALGPKLKPASGDPLHTNSVRVLGPPPPGLEQTFPEGGLLVSMRNLDALAVVHPDEDRLTWSRVGPWHGQHDAQQLPGGELLVFDNQTDRPPSRVVRFDPRTDQETWAFAGTEAAPFYTRLCGAVQPLANGNLLVTESDVGRAFELAGDEIVWEYKNPRRAGPELQYVAALLEVERIAPEDLPAGLVPN